MYEKKKKQHQHAAEAAPEEDTTAAEAGSETTEVAPEEALQRFRLNLAMLPTSWCRYSVSVFVIALRWLSASELNFTLGSTVQTAAARRVITTRRRRVLRMELLSLRGHASTQRSRHPARVLIINCHCFQPSRDAFQPRHEGVIAQYPSGVPVRNSDSLSISSVPADCLSSGGLHGTIFLGRWGTGEMVRKW